MSISSQSHSAARKYDRVREVYECHDHHHAVAILISDYPELFCEICDVLLAFRFTDEMVRAPGGNESEFPKAFSRALRPLGWEERKLTAKLVVEDSGGRNKKSHADETVSTDTHLIDYVKGAVAFDLEWNSKDQTYDRDLYAFRAFFEYRKIAVAVLVTRSNDLDLYFKSLGTYEAKDGAVKSYHSKYGASTTHMGKLLPRLRAGRSGGCPVLAIGITQKQRESDVASSASAPEVGSGGPAGEGGGSVYDDLCGPTVAIPKSDGEDGPRASAATAVSDDGVGGDM